MIDILPVHCTTQRATFRRRCLSAAFSFSFFLFSEFPTFILIFTNFRRCLETIKSREAASSWRETNSRCESKNSRKNWNFDIFQVQGWQGEGEKEQGQQGERSRPGHDWSWSVLKKDEVQFLKSCPWNVLPAAFFINIISSSNFWNLQEAKTLTFNFNYKFEVELKFKFSS